MTTSFRDLINRLNGVTENKKPLNESTDMDTSQDMDLDSSGDDQDLTEETPENLPFSDDSSSGKNATMSDIMSNLDDKEEDNIDSSPEMEPNTNDSDSQEIEPDETNVETSSDILSNPLIKQLLAGGSASLNLTQRKQALDLLKDHLSKETTTESIVEGKKTEKKEVQKSKKQNKKTSPISDKKIDTKDAKMSKKSKN